MSQKLLIGPPPHILSGTTTKKIMLDVIIALMPALIASIVVFGWRALIVAIVTVGSCMIGEYISRRIMGRENSLYDLSAIVTGLLLAFCLPVSIPLHMAVIGGLIATVIIKQLFGGIGQNFINPALGARIALMVSFPVEMTTWNTGNFASSATPLALFQEAATGTVTQELPSYLDMFLGWHTGCIGEVSALALLIGGIYLIVRKVIKPTIPVAFMATVFVFSWLLGGDPVFQILAGGVFLGAIFMATDYTTSPFTTKGQIIFGVLCGFLTVVIRFYGAMPEGVSYAIVIMNLFVPFLNRIPQKIYGGGAAK